MVPAHNPIILTQHLVTNLPLLSQRHSSEMLSKKKVATQHWPGECAYRCWLAPKKLLHVYPKCMASTVHPQLSELKLS